MAHLIIHVNGIQSLAETGDNGIPCEVRTSDMTNENESVFCNATVNASLSAAAINAAIGDAAVAAVVATGRVVEPTDKKTVLGGAVDL
jgi:hypothetical protein